MDDVRWPRKGEEEATPPDPLGDELETLESIAGQLEIMNPAANRVDEEPENES